MKKQDFPGQSEWKEHNSSDAFPVTVFYMDIDETDSPSEKEQKKKHSLLHRVLSDKAFFYTIGEVDSSLKDLAYTFSADGTSIYDFLTGEVAQQMQCLFQFDSMTRKINVYALSDDSYGSDTSILIDRENLASSLTCEGDCDSYFETIRRNLHLEHRGQKRREPCRDCFLLKVSGSGGKGTRC